jgi:pilus assembly protein TadC
MSGAATTGVALPQALAVLALAAALLTAPGRPGLARLGAAVDPTGPAKGGAAVTPAWATAACVAAGALVWAVSGAVAGGVLATAGAAGVGLLARRARARTGPRRDDPADLATAWTQLAVCLEAGLPVAAAAGTAASSLDGREGATLRRVAALLELGADASEAWAGAGQVPSLAAFARAAGRSAGTGSALARAALAEGERLRTGLADAAEARAQRAAVLITAPLGLCFLPAFLVLGVAPIVIGLVGEAVRGW